MALPIARRQVQGGESRHASTDERRWRASEPPRLRVGAGAGHPGEVVRITEPVDLAYQTQALALELERRRRFPLADLRAGPRPLDPHRVECHGEPARARDSSGSTSALPEEYARRLKEPIKPVVLDRPPFALEVRSGDAVDPGALPIPTYFPGDGGPYLTAGLLTARDPATGVSTAGFHRFQVKGPNRLGVSLHSRRRMYEFQQRAERGRTEPRLRHRHRAPSCGRDGVALLSSAGDLEVRGGRRAVRRAHAAAAGGDGRPRRPGLGRNRD